jgi:hypothetical protein
MIILTSDEGARYGVRLYPYNCATGPQWKYFSSCQLQDPAGYSPPLLWAWDSRLARATAAQWAHGHAEPRSVAVSRYCYWLCWDRHCAQVRAAVSMRGRILISFSYFASVSIIINSAHTSRLSRIILNRAEV